LFVDLGTWTRNDVTEGVVRTAQIGHARGKKKEEVEDVRLLMRFSLDGDYRSQVVYLQDMPSVVSSDGSFCRD
jgi:hypothetical protein